ncbi:hypothetical protein WAF17_16640 [Bernardetia sp. ABR2-2B]|uniref:hypothetical protein n=1 Tax=Bernardetia sp. ABR2-2B TaxID=3127472 RepID=UPI0030CFD051
MQEKKPFYLDAINAFWIISEPEYLNGNEIALYFVILKEFNRFGWKKDKVGISNNLLAEKISVSEKTLIKVRNKLKQIGAIDFVKGKKGKLTEYRLLTITCNSSSTNYSKNNITCNNSSTNSSTKFSTNSSTKFSHHKSIDKRLKIKDNTNNHEDFSKENFEEGISENQDFEKPSEEEISESPVETENASPKKVALKKGSQKSKAKKQTLNEEQQEFWDLQINQMPKPHDSDELQDAWIRFRELKKQKGKPLAPIQAEQQLRNLGKMSLKVAIEQTEKAILGDWSQIYPPFPNSSKKTNSKTPKQDFENADYSRTTLK